MNNLADHILASSPAMIYTCKSAGDYGATFVSHNVREQLGYHPEEFLKDPAFWKDHIHPDDRDEVLAGVGEVFTKGQLVHEYRFRNKNGEYRWMRDELRLVRDIARDEDELVGSWLDITERKVMEARYRRFAGLTSDYLHCCTRTSPEPYLVRWIEGAISPISGYSIEDVLAMGCWLPLVHPEDRPAVSDYLFSLIPGDCKTIEFRILTKAGEVRWALENSRCEAGDKPGELVLYGAVTDITVRKRSLEELKHSHELMKYIIEHTRSAIAVHDRELKYLYVSQRYLDEYKVKERNVIGKHHYEVFPDLPQKWRDVHQRALAGEVLSAEEDDYVRADGSVDWTRWECRPWYEADGSIGGIIVYTELITERKHAEEALRDSESFAREAARIARLGRWRWNIPTGAAEWSTVTREIFGLTATERQITYADFINTVHPDDRSSVETAVRNALDHDREYFVEHRILLADGSLRYVQEKGQVHYDDDDKPVRMVGTVLDVTEQKRVEECLRENDRIKSEFIATASHELRTPLAVIQGYAELILDGATPVDPQHLDFLKIIHDKALVLEKIVDELLDVSRMESGRLVCLEFAPVDIVEVLRQVVAHFEKEAPGHRFSLTLPDAPVHLVLDGMKINQVLENLLSNAVKFSPVASRIVVTTGVRGNCFEVMVADEGVGLTPENRQRVFEKFFRAEATDTSVPGLGLGLYLVKKIIEAHRGKVWLDSVPGQGTQFYFCLPLQGCAPGAPACCYTKA